MLKPYEGLKSLASKPAAPAPAKAVVNMGDDEPDESPHRDRLVHAASELIAAVKTGDADALADALQSAYNACGDYSKDEEEAG